MSDRLGVCWGYAGGTMLATVDETRAEVRWAEAAGFEIVVLRVELEGTVTRGGCDTCGEEVPFLVVEETGQRLELEGDATSGLVRGRVLDWVGAHPRIHVNTDDLGASDPMLPE